MKENKNEQKVWTYSPDGGKEVFLSSLIPAGNAKIWEKLIVYGILFVLLLGFFLALYLTLF